MAKDGETVYEYNERVGLSTTRQDRLDKMMGRPIQPDYLKEIRKKIDKVIRRVDQGIL